jgi:hypothetical protein
VISNCIQQSDTILSRINTVAGGVIGLCLASVCLAQTPKPVVELPFEVVTGMVPDSKARSLAVRKGGEDELPSGPRSFDVLRNGTLLINDPLRSRLAIFRGSEFAGGQLIPFPADRINVTPDGQLLLSSLLSPKTQAIGLELSGADRQYIVRRDTSGQSKLVGPSEGEIQGLSRNRSVLHVSAESGGKPLLSLRRLPSDDDFVYVLLQFEQSWSPIKISKAIRKYSLDKPVCEFQAQVGPQYIPPLDEFRVAGGIVYQMFTSANKVSFYSWDTAGCR